MVRYLLLIIFSFSFFVENSWGARKDPPKASIVANAKTGEIIYASNPDLRTQPASMTKMMTLKLLFKALKEKRVSPNTIIRVSEYAASQKPCKIGFKAGEGITVRNAIMALITKSANDVAVAVAERLAGSEKRFVRMMNNEARCLRMYSTIFCNASGWKNSKQLTTVRDMLKLSQSLIKEYPEFFPLFSAKGFYYKGKYHKNHNNLLGESGGITVDGLKTGFVCASGYNISVTAKKGRERVIVVVVGGKTAKKRDALVQWLLTCSFNKLARRRFIEGEIRRKSCAAKLLQASLKRSKTIKKSHFRMQQILESSQKTENIKEIPEVIIEKSNGYTKINDDANILKNSSKKDDILHEKREINSVRQRTEGDNSKNGESKQRSSGVLGESRRSMRRFV